MTAERAEKEDTRCKTERKTLGGQTQTEEGTETWTRTQAEHTTQRLGMHGQAGAELELKTRKNELETANQSTTLSKGKPGFAKHMGQTHGATGSPGVPRGPLELRSQWPNTWKE